MTGTSSGASPAPLARTRFGTAPAVASQPEAPAAPVFFRAGSAAHSRVSSMTAPAAQPAVGAPPVAEPSDDVVDDFPVEAFFIPDDAERLPAAVMMGPDDPITSHHTVPAASQTESPAAELAARLEEVAKRLREEGLGAIGAGESGGDRLDHLLSNVITGYLAGQDD